jgi:hypothetical protein
MGKMPGDRLILFIDSQNVYKNARDAFFDRANHHTKGQIDPIAFGDLICKRTRPMTPILRQVRVYCGQPDPAKEPKTYAANARQRGVWARKGAAVISRPLRYPADWPLSRAQEKGVDVALAVDFVTMAVNGDYDFGVIASTDSDLRPALEFVEKHYPDTIKIAVAAWKSEKLKSRLSVRGSKIWCHYFGQDDYNALADATDYAR